MNEFSVREQAVGILVVVVLLGVGIYSTVQFDGKGMQNVPQGSSEDEIVQTLKTVQEKLAPVEKSQPAEIYEVPYDLDWVNGKGAMIPLRGSWFSLYAREPGSEGSSPALESEEFSRQVLEQGDAHVTSALTSLGFTESKANFRQEPEEIPFRQRGFEKGELKCLARLSLMAEPYGDVFCGKYDAQQDEWRKELKSLINPGNDPDILFDVTALVGDHAQGSIYSRGPGGYSWMAVKENGTWKVVFEGHDLAYCSLVDQYQFPREVYVNCIEEGTNEPRFEEFDGQSAI